MNKLTSGQRKIVYGVAIVLLLAPIVALGRPAARDSSGKLTPGGKLAQLRQEYELGEASLGNVDPSSSTMNLVLLGFRGIATSRLHEQALDYRDRKQWAQLRATTDSIIMLQPHYIKVWQFQGWNLAYNVSAEWDNVDDRYYWVKEGGKFYMRGTGRNRRSADLAYNTGYVLGQKVGRSDERDYFRKFFLEDPNREVFDGGPDRAFNRGYDPNRSFDDNYLASRDWYLEANDRETKYQQHTMMRELFRSYPAHAYMEYADALQKDGRFGDATRRAWLDGFNAWTRDYGREEFPSPIGPVHLEVIEPAQYAEIARENSERLKRTVTPEAVREYIDFLQNTSNYRYWRTRSLAESREATAEAHKAVYDGEQLFKQGKLPQAREKLLAGLKSLEDLFKNFPRYEEDDLAVEEVLMGMIYLRNVYELNGEEVPQDLPLQRIWTANEQDSRMTELQRRFRMETTISSTK
jgi:hypothetical protein